VTTAVILMEIRQNTMRRKTTMVDPRMDALSWLRKQLTEECPDLARAMLERVVGELMSGEADVLCGAADGERSPERVNQRNGYRSRRWDTRAGTIELEIPKLRTGTYFSRLAHHPAPQGRAGPGGRDRRCVSGRGLHTPGRQAGVNPAGNLGDSIP